MKRPHLTGPHNIVLLADKVSVDPKAGDYAIFTRPPADLEFISPSGVPFITTGEALVVYYGKADVA